MDHSKSLKHHLCSNVSIYFRLRSTDIELLVKSYIAINDVYLNDLYKKVKRFSFKIEICHLDYKNKDVVRINPDVFSKHDFDYNTFRNK